MKDMRVVASIVVYICCAIPVLIWSVISKTTDWRIIFVPIVAWVLFFLAAHSKRLNLFPSLEPDARIIFHEEDPTDVDIEFEVLDLDKADERGYAIYKIEHVTKPENEELS